MNPTLVSAIANPRFAQPYGSERGEWGWSNVGVPAVDSYMKSRLTQWDGKRGLNDNNEH